MFNQLRPYLWFWPLIIIVVISIFLIGIGTWQFITTPRDTLAKLLPSETAFYAHLDYQPEKLVNLPAEKFFNQFFADAQSYFLPDKSLNNLWANLDREIGLAVTPDNHWLLLLKIKSGSSLTEQTLPANVQLINNHYLVIANNSLALKQFNENSSLKLQTSRGRKNNLATQLINQTSNAGEPIRIYTSSDWLKNNLPEFIGKNLLNNYLADQTPIYFAATPDLNFLVNANSPLNLSAGELNNILPDSTYFAVNLTEPQNFFANLNKNLQKNNLALYWQLQNFTQAWDNYGLNNSDLIPLWRQPIELIITKNENDKKNYLAEWHKTINQTQITNLENAIKKIAADYFPRQDGKKLPDGTKVVELVSDPEIFAWQDLAINELTAKQLWRRPGGTVWPIAYLNQPNFIIASQAEDLKNLINGDKIIDLGQLCPKISQPNIYLNFGDFMTDNKLAKYKDFLSKISLEFTDYQIKGCFGQ